MEIADNRAHTSLNPNAVLTDWGDGQNHSDTYCDPGCITQPNRESLSHSLVLPWMSDGLARPVHTKDQQGAAGTSFAISYEVRFRTLAVLFFDDGHV